jgi:nuclear-control-of-ATPase protein 2
MLTVDRRNVDDILTSSIPGSNGMLSYKEHGLLLCEVHVLRENGLRVFPSELHHDYIKHLNKLTDIKAGVDQQAKVARRIQKMWEQVVMRKLYSA